MDVTDAQKPAQLNLAIRRAVSFAAVNTERTSPAIWHSANAINPGRPSLSLKPLSASNCMNPMRTPIKSARTKVMTEEMTDMDFMDT